MGNYNVYEFPCIQKVVNEICKLPTSNLDFICDLCVKRNTSNSKNDIIYISKKKFISAWNLLIKIKEKIIFKGFPKNNNHNKFLLIIYLYENSDPWTVWDVVRISNKTCPVLFLLESKSGTKAKLIVKNNNTEIIPF